MFDFLKRPIDLVVGNYAAYYESMVKDSLPDASYAISHLQDQGIEEEVPYKILKVQDRDGNASTITIQVDGKPIEVNSDFFMQVEST